MAIAKKVLPKLNKPTVAKAPIAKVAKPTPAYPPLTKHELVSSIAEAVGVPKDVVSGFFGILAATAIQEAPNGFVIPDIGKLVLVDRAARMGRNPATGATIKIPAKRVLKFKISKKLKDAVTPKKVKR